MEAESSREQQGDIFHAFRCGKTDPARRQHLIILTAIEEMIAERKQQSPLLQPQQPSANEYFAAIMTALEAQDQSHTPELVCLMEAVIGHVDRAFLRAKFKPIAEVLTTLLKTNLDHEMTAFVRDLVACLGKLLMAQEVGSGLWSSPSTLKTFYVLLSCFREKRPKVRKAAMAATVEMLRLHAGKRAWALGRQVADFSNSVLAACTASDCLPTLHLLGFLQEGLPFLPEEAIPKLAERILRLQSLESNMVVQASFQALRALVKAEAAPLAPDTVQALAEAAIDVQPPLSERDPEVCIAFCELVAASLERLVLAHRGQRGPARALLTRAMHALVARCEASEAAAVHECACSAMRRALCLCTGGEDVRSLPAEEKRHVTEALAAVGKLLDFRYHKAWGVGLPFLGSLFIHFKQGSAGPLLDPLLQKLALLHDTVLASEPKLVRPFEKCVALAVEGLGIEKVLEVLPLEEGGLVAGRRAWLLPVLAAHGKRQPCRLCYFQAHILELARRSDELVAAGKGHAKQLQQQRQRVVQLWALLPAFCAQPRDVAAAFGTLAPALANALQDPQGTYPELLTPVCLGLQALVHAVREASDVGGGGASEAGAEADLAAVAALSKKLLPTLFAALDGTPLEEGSAAGVRVRTLSDTISAYARVAPPAFVASLFKKLVQKMLEATSRHQQPGDGQQGRPAFDAGGSNSKAVVLCELSLALVPSLDAASLALLYKVVRPLVRLQDRDVALQKRAYRVLGALCEHQAAAAFLTPETLADLLPLLTESLLTCHVSARQMRLRVLTAVIAKLDADSQEHWALLAGMVGEVLLCLKDANGKAREAAYGALVAMARVRAERQEDLSDFVQVVLAALAAETPHMRSAAVLALAHLIFEFAPQAPAFRSSIPDLLATVLLLGADPAKEVVKAVVSFVRVCVAACPPQELEPLLPAVIQCLFASNSKVRFRAKVKIILKKLCRRFGYDAVLALAPESDRKLVHHIQKQAARGERIAASQAARGMDAGETKEGEGGGGGHGHRQRKFERMLGDDEEDSSGDEEEDEEAEQEGEEGEGRTRPRRQQGVVADKRKLEKMALVRENGNHIVDLLDSAMLKNLKLQGGSGVLGRGLGGRAVVGKRGREMVGGLDSSDGEEQEEDGDDDDEAVEFNAAGKLVVRDDRPGSGKMEAEEEEEGGFDFAEAMREDAAESEEEGPLRRGNKRQKRADGSFSKHTAAGGGGGRSFGTQPRQPQQQQQQHKGSKAWGGKGKAPGAAFKSKKAGGDVRAQGQLEPYAYIPLNPKMLRKRNKREGAATFGAVVGNTKARREERKQAKARSRRGAARR